MPTNFKQEIESLSQSFATLSNEFKAYAAKVKPDSATNDNDEDDAQAKMMDRMHQMCSNIHDRVDRLANHVYGSIDNLHRKHEEHKNNHLPPLPSQAIAKLLKTCGMNESFDIKKPAIYCKASKNVLEVEMPAPAKS